MSASKIRKGSKLHRVAAYVSDDGVHTEVHEVTVGEAVGRAGKREVTWRNSIDAEVSAYANPRDLARPMAHLLNFQAADHGMLMVVSAYTADASSADKLRARCMREAIRCAHRMHVMWGDAAGKSPIADDVKPGAACLKA